MSDTERLSSAIADRYVIERHLGQGGMATVYLAHDVRHDRPVALKVLRPELAAVIGAERFLKEITVTANLQHPHILPLHDSGEADGFLYYVMPYVEGETLRDLLDREKQLGIEEAVEITKNVAQALDYAHRQNVIHRDIKPENILMHDGQAQVADFGIALAVSEASSNRLTETGLSIGTPHYMSPEQAMGDREVDARSDVYSLAAMLYEMLTGDPPYTGSTAQAIVAKVITERAPPVTVTRDTVPQHIALAIQKGLAKLPADRFHSAAEFADALAVSGAQRVAVAELEPTAVRKAPRTFSTRHVLALGAVAVVAAIVAIVGWLRPGSPARLARFLVATEMGQEISTNQNGSTLALSPDGSILVYVGPQQQLMVRDLGQLTARPLPGTEGARAPFFSPDGDWVGFCADGRVAKVALRGGPPLTVADANACRGGTWTPDDRIVYAPNTGEGLWIVSASGGAPERLTTLDASAGETSHRWPSALPNGKGVVFTVFTGTIDESFLAVYSFEDDSYRSLNLHGLSPRYANTGHLVYGTSDGFLVAVPFDPGSFEVTGGPVSILEGVLRRGSIMSEFAISNHGDLAYLSGDLSDLQLVTSDTVGNETVLVEGIEAALGPRYSPTGDRITVRTTESGTDDIRVFDVEQGVFSRLTFDGANDYPVWNPAGDTIYFTSDRDEGDRDVFRRAADGSGGAERVLARPDPQWEIAIAPNGTDALIREIRTDTRHDIIVVGLDSANNATDYLHSEFLERSGAISPDGNWLAYTSNESGADEVYVRAFPTPSGRWQVSSGGGTEPVWAPEDDRIYYRVPEGIMAVSVTTAPTFAPGRRWLVFESDRMSPNGNHTNYDVHPDGDRFVYLRAAEQSRTALVVVLNWFDELEEATGSD